MAQLKYSPQLKPFLKSFVQGHSIALAFPIIMGLFVSYFAGTGLYLFLLLGAYQAYRVRNTCTSWFEVFLSDKKYDGDKYALDWFLRIASALCVMYAVMGTALLARALF